MKAKAASSGRGFVLVTHPEPEADTIEADWTIRVEVGETSV